MTGLKASGHLNPLKIILKCICTVLEIYSLAVLVVCLFVCVFDILECTEILRYYGNVRAEKQSFKKHTSKG